MIDKGSKNKMACEGSRRAGKEEEKRKSGGKIGKRLSGELFLCNR